MSQSGKFRSTKPASAPLWEPDEAPTERARFVTNPMSARPPGGPTAGGLSSPFGTAPASSRALSPDAPTPAVPLASLLEDTQEDRLWGGSDGERKTALEAAEQDLTLYRLAIDATNLNYEQSFTILALTVEFFHKGEHVERVEQHALRVAAGVILRVQKQLNSEPLRILAPFYLNQLRSIFQAWHLYRELAKAIDNRGDFLVRMRGKGDQLILDSLFSEEGRSMLAARVDGFTSACARLQLNSEALKRAEWIGKLLMYRTENDQWQVPPEACLGLCTRLLREINDDTVMGAIRNLAAASWDGLCKETNYLRDGFAGIVTEDTGHGVILIRTAVPMVGIPVLPAEDSVSYFPEHDAFREQDKDRKERPKDGVFRLIRKIRDALRSLWLRTRPAREDDRAVDLDRLSGFLTFARALNFSAAARQLNISQPALHGQVRQLEHELGVKLYTRDAGRLQLTEQGRSLLLFGQNLLDEVGRFETDLRGEPQSEELRLGAGLTATLYLLPGPLRDFRALWPDVECRVGVHHRADVLSLVRSAELDLGVTSIERTPPDLESFVCARTRHALIVPTGHPLVGGRKITLADIAEHPLVLPRAGLQHRRMIDDAFRKAGVEYRAALETEGWEVMKHYVALGFGIAIVNDLCLAHSVPPEIVSRPLHELFPERIYRAVWAKKRQLPEPAREFSTHLRKRYARPSA